VKPDPGQEATLLEFPAARSVTLRSGIRLAVHEAGSGPAVVLCHGFPELGYSWRHQIAALARAGYRAIAPDQRGYGDSSRPQEIEAYGMGELCQDLVDLLDALGLERAIFAGHDWGGFVAWAMPVLHPQRCAGVIGVNTPNRPFPTTPMLRRVFGNDEQLYILWFQAPGVAERVLDANVRAVFEKLMRRPPGPGEPPPMLAGGSPFNPFRDIAALPERGEALLTPAEVDVYTAAFTRSGFRGPVSWYRNVDANQARYPTVGVDKLSLPCLMICAERDPALPPAQAADMPQRCSDLEMHTIADCGHWTQQEKPAELNELLLQWLTRRFPPGVRL
jgi:pimeloyl-ACP methyl ester carboxylesterase